jgi:hypothetical protein
MARLPPIQRTSSIEREPRTLGIDQIQSARVREWVCNKFSIYFSFYFWSSINIIFVGSWIIYNLDDQLIVVYMLMDLQNLAIYILNTKTFEEASRIFTEVVIFILFTKVNLLQLWLLIFVNKKKNFGYWYDFLGILLLPKRICYTKFGVLLIFKWLVSLIRFTYVVVGIRFDRRHAYYIGLVAHANRFLFCPL